jgi:hypothetical protein
VGSSADAPSIAAIFASKYRHFYASVLSDNAEMRSILTALDTQICAGNPYLTEFVLRCQDVSDANDKLHPHKTDGLGLSTDYFLNAIPDISTYRT